MKFFSYLSWSWSCCVSDLVSKIFPAATQQKSPAVKFEMLAAFLKNVLVGDIEAIAYALDLRSFWDLHDTSSCKILCF